MIKNNKLGFYMVSLVMLSFLTTYNAEAQTEGTLTFTFTETHSGSSKNTMAVWIEDTLGAFVKTKMRFWGSGTNDHLPSWVSSSSQNVTDAITGATLSSSTNPTAFGEKTVTWDGTNVPGTTVADGHYKIFVETAWNNPEPSHNQHSAIIDFMFEKSSVTSHITPAGNSYFSNISIDWIPSTTSLEKINSNDLVSVYPNPSNGIININFDKEYLVSRILIENVSGEIVYQQRLNQVVSEVKSINLQHISKGVYFIEVLFFGNSNTYKNKFIIR